MCVPRNNIIMLFSISLTGRVDKLDSSFSRSRSSSMSSLENISSEAVQCLAFADSYTKKTGMNLLCTSDVDFRKEKTTIKITQYFTIYF